MKPILDTYQDDRDHRLLMVGKALLNKTTITLKDSPPA